jgi:ABC-type multidrug transport system fused ATPase/permease subunit
MFRGLIKLKFHGNQVPMQQDYESLQNMRGQRFVIKPVPGWVIALVSVAIAVAGFVLFLVSASLLLVLAPIFIAIGLYLRWRFLKALRSASQNYRQDETIIETEYRVHDDTRHR